MVRSSLRKFLSRFKYTVLTLLVCAVAYAAFIPGSLNVESNITLGGTVDGRDVATDGGTLDNLNTTLGLGSLTAAEVTQLQAIDTETIINSQWAFLGASDQGIATTVTPSYTGIVLTDPLEQTQETTPSNPSAGSNKLYFKSDDNLYKLNSGGSEVQVGIVGVTPDYLDATHGNDCSWTTTSTVLVDPAIDASCTFTNRESNGFTGVASIDDGTPGNNRPGIVFTPSKTGPVKICAYVNSMNHSTSGAGNVTVAMIDFTDSQTRKAAFAHRPAASTNRRWSGSFCIILSLTASTEQQVQLRWANSGNTAVVMSQVDSSAGIGVVLWVVHGL